jgi:phosphatidylinositol dimannoside acyltransferase
VTAAPGTRGAPAAPTSGEGGTSVRDSLFGRLANVPGLVPEGLVLAAADVTGALWYRATPARAARARRNLARAVAAMTASGRGSPLARRAAEDPDALERLVRLAYRHAARYYGEVARAGRIRQADVTRRLVVDDADTAELAFASGRQMILVGMHFGALELPAVYVSGRLGHPVTVPMETVPEPAIQRWFEETRGRVGVRIVTLRGARRELLAAIGRGESVGLVADRDITGGGVLVPYFGHAARFPIGPAMLAVETGLPVFVGGARRLPEGRYRARLIAVEAPPDGARRARVTMLTARIAAAMETIIADAPEQWWGAFHAVWPDLEPDITPRSEPA